MSTERKNRRKYFWRFWDFFKRVYAQMIEFKDSGQRMAKKELFVG